MFLSAVGFFVIIQLLCLCAWTTPAESDSNQNLINEASQRETESSLPLCIKQTQVVNTGDCCSLFVVGTQYNVTSIYQLLVIPPDFSVFSHCFTHCTC